jgi:hypothetical protein
MNNSLLLDLAMWMNVYSIGAIQDCDWNQTGLAALMLAVRNIVPLSLVSRLTFGWRFLFFPWILLPLC